MMKAIVLREPGPPEALRIEEVPRPVLVPGAAIIRVGAFGLNRSELFTRRGQSPGITFPRILGIEAVGEVVEADSPAFAPGDRVATVMGGMGRVFDGSYAEYVRVPVGQVRAVHANLPYAILGALPEMLQTAWGTIFSALDLQAGEMLLIRGGTTSVGLAAAALARRAGAIVTATSRRDSARDFIGTDSFRLDDGRIAAQSDRYDRVLELVGTGTLLDSLACLVPGGTLCMAGMVGDRWTLDAFEPMVAIPSKARLTTYSGDVEDFMSMPLDDLLEAVAAERLPVKIGRVFSLEDIVEAHRLMEAGGADGKIVMLTAFGHADDLRRKTSTT